MRKGNSPAEAYSPLGSHTQSAHIPPREHWLQKAIRRVILARWCPYLLPIGTVDEKAGPLEQCTSQS